MKFSIKQFLCIMMLLPLYFTIQAERTLTKSDILYKTAVSPHKGRVVLKEIENLRDDTVVITIINEFGKPGKKEAVYTLKPKQKATWDVTFNIINARLKNSDKTVEIFHYTGEGSDKLENGKRNNDNDQGGETPNEEIISSFNSYLNSIQFLSDSIYTSDSIIIAGHLNNLNLSSINKSAYLEEEHVKDFVKAYNDSLNKYLKDSLTIVDGYIGSLGPDVANGSKESLLTIYKEKISHKAAIIEPLDKIIDEQQSSGATWLDAKLIIVSGCVVLLCVILGLWYWRVNKKNKAVKVSKVSAATSNDDSPSLVVVGQKAATTLKKQSLDDAYDNESFIRIDTSDFCEDSLVRTIYFKTSCIKEIYNMYAEDLRHPDNPKEDGCMVLGRWVYDEKSGKYDVSLEYTVMPGDDAVFSEYELNFGGKIKLKMSEKLRKLRKDSGLQYDLTCWVHSHPGLGVFFSSSDNNVQHQLKHPSFPGFLTALVVDILTPKQDMGIFTFKDAESVNSKGELTKIYSLEDLYNQALQTERRSFDSTNYYDILGEVKSQIDSCFGIHLSNSAIIDMTYMTSKPNGFIGFAHGYTIKRGERTHCVVSEINDSESSPNTDMIGCFIVASHCSIPSIRKAVSKYIGKINFVLVYTASNGLLTAIPVIDNDLVSSDSYYGEQTLENLKIWTRRRR